MRTFANSYSWTKYYSQNINSNMNQWNSCIKLLWKKKERKKERKKKVVVEDKGFDSTIHLFSGEMFTALTITNLRCPDSASVGSEDHWNRNISSFDRTQKSKIWKAKVICIFFEFASFSKILGNNPRFLHKNRIAIPLQLLFCFSSLKITIRKTKLWLQLYDGKSYPLHFKNSCIRPNLCHDEYSATLSTDYSPDSFVGGHFKCCITHKLGNWNFFDKK